MDIKLACGSITEVDARAYVLGLFRGVEPSGPAAALNRVLEGLITEFTTRRMLTGNVGEVFLIPTGRYPVRADMVLFAGMGAFDRFTDEAQQLCAENCIRTFIRSRIDEFATVLLGAGSVRDTAKSLENILIGFFRGLKDADQDGRFRRITICEFDRTRFLEIKRELFRLSSTRLFDDVEVTIDEEILPAPVEPAAAPRLAAAGPDPIYLIVRQAQPAAASVEFHSSVLTSEEKATVVTGVNEVALQDLEALLKQLDDDDLDLQKLSTLGEQLAQMILHPLVLAVLPKMKNRQMVVVHDAPSSQIPWETIQIDGWFPAVDVGLSRRYMADDLSVAKWLEKRKYGRTLDLLLVVNPTGDLTGAEREGDRIQQLLSAHPWVKIRELRGPAATKETLLKAFNAGDYDVVHYAGHAEFVPYQPERSGIRCYGHQVLSGAELAALGNLPGLVFFNACESARVRGRAKSNRDGVIKRIQQNVGLAEAFMRGGVANYVGTYWPVGDDAAKTFADAFYPALINGRSISQALLEARIAVRKERSADWADYIHYGSPNFILKHPE
ncbi:MAG: CHAT domain-containing protein [Desulfobacterales bacterium]